MQNTPHSLSWSEDIDKLVLHRCQQERMTRSEYIRKCIREEATRANAQRVLAMSSMNPFAMAGA